MHCSHKNSRSHWLHHLFLGSSFSKPANISIALCSGVPKDSDTGATIPEVPSGINNQLTGYARIDLGDPSTDGDDNWLYSLANNAVGSGVLSNKVNFVFDKALLDWGWVSGIAITDSPDYKTGNLLMHAQLDNPRVVYMGDTPKFDADLLEIHFR